MAASVAVHAYAPYSGFRVGAAVLGERGKYLGTNVENACGGLGICAERTAISAAIAAGERRILAVAVACIDAMPGHGIDERLPCGGCRQWLAELAPDAKIVVLGSETIYTVEELLPNPFRLRHWGASHMEAERVISGDAQ
jgi:cytidine deaminase